MTNALRFVCRIKGGSEANTLAIAAKRLHTAWMPFEFCSYRSGRGRRRKSEIKVNPIMPYLIGTGSRDQFAHFMEWKHAWGPVWFVATDRQWHSLLRYRAEVTNQFDTRLSLWRRDEKRFHCQFKLGQAVRFREFLDSAGARFLRMTEDGNYELGVQMMGREVKVKAHPDEVDAA